MLHRSKGYIDVPTGRVRVLVEGPRDAPALVLAHSIAADLTMWDAQATVWAERFRVLRYDLPGHGRTTAPRRPLTIAQLGRDALALMNAFDIERAHWCGLSLGGMIGLWLLAHAPERVDHAVLAQTAAHLGPPELWDGRIRTVARRGLEAIAEPTLKLWFPPDFLEREPETAARMADMIRTTSAAGFQACAAAIRDMDLRDDLARIRRPILVIVGEHDRATPPEKGVLIAQALPGARLVTLPVGHFGPVEEPWTFARVVERFLIGSADH